MGVWTSPKKCQVFLEAFCNFFVLHKGSDLALDLNSVIIINHDTNQNCTKDTLLKRERLKERERACVREREREKREWGEREC